jgi:lysophospholipase L1-like esterase
LVALGDSTSCGEGVGLRVAPEATWPALLTAACPGAELLSLATAGAGIADVRRRQLPQALAAAPDVVTLLIGLNDLSRAGFDRQAYAEQLSEVVLAVRATGALLLLGRLHDASLLLPLPPGLRDLVRSGRPRQRRRGRLRRVDVRLLDLAAVRPLRSRSVWDVDRVHPNGIGHALIAAAAAEVLRELGFRLLPLRAPDLPSTPGPAREVTWLLRHGLPWLATHVPQVVLPAVLAAVRPGRTG